MEKKNYPYGIPPFKSPESWGAKSKVTHLTKGDGEDKRVVGIKVETHKDSFVVPVANLKQSEPIIAADKANRGSKYLKPSFSVLGHSYQVSRKK